MAAVLGGTQSLHTNSFDEALALPSEEAVKIALRTQQIIAHESGAADTIDPLGGSFFIESLTNQMQEGAEEYFEKIRDMGEGSMLKGAVEGIKRNFYQKEIASASYKYYKEFESGMQAIVGVNAFKSNSDSCTKPSILKISDEIAEIQVKNLTKIKNTRNDDHAKKALEKVKQVAKSSENMMPALITAVKAYCSVGEIVDILREVFGVYKEEGIY